MSQALTMPEFNEAVRLYKAGIPAIHIAAQMGRGKDTISRALKCAGLKIKVGRPKLSEDADPWAPYETWRLEDALRGSFRLLHAIQRAGLRP